jgi:hypothetical protein
MGAYTWQIPALPPCRRHWGWPLSSLDPYAATYLKALYAGRGAGVVAAALGETIRNNRVPDGDFELFCDPMTWQFWLDPFSHKLPPKDDVGSEAASAILRPEILANRNHGYLSRAIRAELESELRDLHAALPESDRKRVSSVRVTTNVYAPLAASADNVTMTITISEGLVRYAFVREVTSREGELKAILDKLSRSGDQAAAVTDITLLASKTLDAFRRSLSFTLAHELAHLWVPTIDEREADCNGLATVMAERGSPDIGVFEAINDAVLQAHSAYWNGLPADLIDQRFKLIEVWRRAAQRGADIRAICVTAWKWLDKQ